MNVGSKRWLKTPLAVAAIAADGEMGQDDSPSRKQWRDVDPETCERVAVDHTTLLIVNPVPGASSV